MFILGLIIGGLIMTIMISALSLSGRMSAEEDYNKLLENYNQLKQSMSLESEVDTE